MAFKTKSLTVFTKLPNGEYTQNLTLTGELLEMSGQWNCLAAIPVPDNPTQALFIFQSKPFKQ